MSTNNYHSFFRLYRTAPNMSAYLMDFLVWGVKLGAFEAMLASYQPTIPLPFLMVSLRTAWCQMHALTHSCHYDQEELAIIEVEDVEEFLTKVGAVLVAGGTAIDVRQSRSRLAARRASLA